MISVPKKKSKVHVEQHNTRIPVELKALIEEVGAMGGDLGEISREYLWQGFKKAKKLLEEEDKAS